MKNVLAIFFLLYGLSSNSQDLTQYVNPFIGTGGHGHTFPGAATPFGMVQLSPDTRIDGSWDGCSGYHYSDSLIYGFSHTHLSGTGCSDYGDIAFMPTFVDKPVEPIETIKTLYYTFSHKNEQASAGYYSVLLDNGIKVELTATTRVGLQQYTYSRHGYAWITLNLEHRDELLEGKIAQVSGKSFSGFRRSKAWAQNQLVYYYFELSKKPRSFHITKGDKGETRINLLFYVNKGEKILVKTALSSVDENGAMNNMKKEMPGWDFGNARHEAENSWNKELSRIKVYGGTQDEKVNFYTALYHCMIHPSVMSDADGRYRGRDGQVHKAEGFDYYTVFSLWDTHRALHPLLNIIDKKRSHDFIMTFKAQYEQSGRLPMWELWGNETNCMIGFHSVSVILDAYVHGVISKEELRAIYPAVKAEAMSNRFGLDKFREKGYLEVEDESESVSKTLEYSYDMWCVAEIAIVLEDTLCWQFRAWSCGYQNLYDNKTRFARPRKNGDWLSPFEPREVNNHFTEANSWQYSYTIPRHVRDLEWRPISEIFNANPRTTGREQSDITGLIGQYAHGNEPSHHIPYLFSSVDSTKKYIQRICSEFYKNNADGLCGNEDCGQMSAWYVFSTLGFYSVTPGTNKYFKGLSLFDSFLIDQQHYIPDYSVYNTSFNFRSGNGFWPFVSAPIISTRQTVFVDSAVVSIKYNLDSVATLVKGYFINDTGFRIYESPFYIYKNTTIKAALYRHNLNRGEKLSDIGESDRASCFATANFYKKPNNYSIQINSTYNKQYTADGDEGLIDGLRGDLDWRKGRWQGYQGQDFEAVIDMKVSKPVKTIHSSFLQDTRAWIVFPESVVFYGSNDGVTFEEIRTVANTVADSSMNTQILDFNTGAGKSYRYIRVRAINYGKLPAWHPGAGGEAFIFIDEIWIE